MLTAVVCLLALASAEALPEHVYLRSAQRGLAWENEYALLDGKLWIKPNSDTSAGKGGWQLFDGTGVPHGGDAKSFLPTHRLVEFATDGTMILAVSNTGRFYNWQPTLSAHTVWMDKLGTPFAQELLAPKRRAWSFSFSVDVAPEKRLTPMHDIVSYYQDADGNKIQFGFTATLFVLDPDGQRIRFWDTGLPASFHKAFSTPERGRFIAANLSAAASTIFVIDAGGRMFTKMHDYEMFAACPGLRYTYRHARRTRGDDEILSLFAAERTLPLPDWREQPPIVLEGSAGITTAITILQTGKGNAARELRVQGRDQDSQYGYFFKPIFGSDWSFKVTGERFADDARIAHLGGAPVLGKLQDKTYSGKVEREPGVGRGLDVELVDFYYYDTPARLRVHLGPKQFEMTFHTADAWTPSVQQKYHPELVGSVVGEPKLLMGTLEIPKDVLESKDPEIKAAVDLYFRAYDLVTFAFEVSANDRQVTIRTRGIQRESTGYADYKLRTPLKMDLKNAQPVEGIEVSDGFTYLATLPGLQLLDLDSLGKNDAGRIEETIGRNQSMLKQIRHTELKNREQHLTKGLLTATGAGAFYVLEGVVNLLGVPAYHTLAGGLSMTGGIPLNMYARMNLTLALNSTEDYQRAERILHERLVELIAKRDALKKTK